MGSKSSKPERNSASFDRGDIRRSSRRSSGKVDTPETILAFIQTLKAEIENYGGYRDERYRNIQILLTKNSQDLQLLRGRSKKNKLKVVDHALKEINICLRLLEEKVLKNERALDLAAEESHSFINQKMPLKTTKKPERSKKRFDNMEQLEQRVDQIEVEINKAIPSEDKQQLAMLEKKIHILYTDLEMITADPHTPLHERKELLGRQLIKYNHKLKRVKNADRKSTASTQSKDEDFSCPQNTTRNTMRRIQAELQSLEVQVSTFTDVKSSETFTSIKQSLNQHWDKLHNLKNEEDSIKKSKQQLLERVKNILSSLQDQAHRNEAKLAADFRKLREIKKDLKHIADLVNTKNKNGLQHYEEALENLAERAKNIGDFEELQKDKEAILEELEEIHCKLESFDKMKAKSVGGSEANDKLRSIWMQLHNSLEDLTALDNNKPVVDILEAVLDDINEKLQVLKQENKSSAEKPEPIYAQPFAETRSTINSQELSKGKVKEAAPQEHRDSIDNILDTLKKAENLAMESSKAVETKPITEELPAATPSINRLTLESVMDVDAKVQELTKEITSFSGKSEDKQYLGIKDALATCASILYAIPTDNKENLCTAKTEILDQINTQHAQLEEQLTKNRKENLTEIAQIKDLVDQVKNLKKRIDCFNGLHKNALYVQIEDSLLLCKQKLGELGSLHEDLKPAIEQTKIKITQYLKILDEKSIKADTSTSASNRQSVTYDSYKQLEEVRNVLLKIKVEMESYSGTKRDDEFDRICSNLMRCNEKLDAIIDMDSNSVKASKEQYTNYIKELLKYFEEKTPKS